MPFWEGWDGWVPRRFDDVAQQLPEEVRNFYFSGAQQYLSKKDHQTANEIMLDLKEGRLTTQEAADRLTALFATRYNRLLNRFMIAIGENN